jgi:hypothetical protein
VEESLRSEEGRHRDSHVIVRIGSQSPFSSIDRCPLEIPRLVAPLVGPVRLRVGEKGHRALRDLTGRRGTGPTVLLVLRRALRRAAVTSERRATAPNAESIDPTATRAARHDRRAPVDAMSHGTEASPASARLVATTAMTSTPGVHEVTHRDAHGPPAPAATARRPVRRDPMVVTTATPAVRALIVPRDPVPARQDRHVRPAAMTAIATRDLPGPVRSRRMVAHLDPAAMSATHAIAARVSRRAAPDPTPEMDRVTRDRAAAALIDVRVN